ncbi:MAG: hypothetical protein H0U92_03240, partial [Actinobacteria bacterium]|nr:hypothetical protein [Actinomycetota bacterium]
LGLSATACSRGAHQAAPPPHLPAATVPPTLSVLGTNVVLKPNTSKKTARAFRSVGAASLVREQGVWELRKADRLVGTLQLVTLDSKRSDTRNDRDRTSIRAQILSGDAAQLDLDGLPVWSAKDGDRVLYVWYGRQVLAVLQVKSDDLDADETVTQLVTTITDSAAWPRMPLDVFEEKI